jgi:hypothetical protein
MNAREIALMKLLRQACEALDTEGLTETAERLQAEAAGLVADQRTSGETYIDEHGQPTIDVAGGKLRLSVRGGMLRIYGYSAPAYPVRIVPESGNVVLIGFESDDPTLKSSTIKTALRR